MDFCCISTVILFLFFVVILRAVYVVKRRKGHGPLDRRKPVKVMVVAGSGTPCCIDRTFRLIFAFAYMYNDVLVLVCICNIFASTLAFFHPSYIFEMMYCTQDVNNEPFHLISAPSPLFSTLCLYVRQPDRIFKILRVRQSKFFLKNSVNNVKSLFIWLNTNFREPGTRYIGIYNVDYYKMTGSQNV